MTQSPPPQTARVISISVREMVDFVLRTGDLGGTGDFMGSSRALAGTRGHQKIQKTRPQGYRSEVRVSHDIPGPDFVLRIQGRIDGVHEANGGLLIEEIKTVMGAWNRRASPLHWAQAKIYAAIFAGLENRNGFLDIQLTYLELDSGEVTEFREAFALGDLRAFFDQVSSVYLQWAAAQSDWIKVRDASIGGLSFPHGQYRPGQRALAVAAYRALTSGSKLFAEAPTGIGKTVSVLFPAIKALGEGHVEKIFFLTAKTTGRAIAETSVAAMRHCGLRLRVLTLTAKDKICFNNGQPCEVQACPFAIGYYDRVKAALKDALSLDSLGQSEIEQIARRHNVCPFELSLDLSLWVDLIICDYNYLFDPSVALKRFFAEEGGEYAFLIDEAHNLVDRAREMFSADITVSEIAGVRDQLELELPACGKLLARAERSCADFRKQANAVGKRDLVTRELPAAFLSVARKFLDAAEEWLVLNQPAHFRAPLLQLYFRFFGFLRTADLYDDRYATIFEIIDSEQRLRLFCLDPSRGIQNALGRGKAALFFSATLRPIDYFREILGGDIADTVLQLESPFPQENLAVLLQARIQTDFRARHSSYGRIASGIGALVQARPGNYLVFFPSFKYLQAVQKEFEQLHPFLPLISQSPAMPERERQKFVAAFQSEVARPLVGFAVMGGVFGEGIDLVGERLVGAIVVGVGLPQLCLERDLIREYFDQKNGRGFEYAYVYPGLNRVIQAAGRVIRSETDRGILLLIDARFNQRRYRELLPRWWTILPVHTDAQLTTAAEDFSRSEI